MKKNLLFSIILSFLILNCKAQTPVTVVSSNSMVVKINGVNLKIPYYRNNSLSTPNSNFTRAIITIHGTNRNADDYYNNMVSVATSAGQINSTLIIAPQFLMEMDINNHSLVNDYLFWTNSGWKEGRNSETSSSINPRTQSISSYSIIDTIVYRIAQKFPTISSITITGHSAGGQVLNRYAASNQVEQVVNPCIQYVIANPSSYLYMTNERYNTISNAFSVPTTSCTDYDEWHKGFYKLQTQCPYAYNVGMSTIRNQYAQRHVVYLLGMLDTDPNDSDLDISCGGMLQGSQRFERGMIHYQFLKYYYGNVITQKHILDSIPNVGHSNYGMYNSTIGRSYLFNVAPCGGATTSIDGKNNIDAISISPNPTDGVMYLTNTVPNSVVEIYTATGELLQKIICKNSCTFHLADQPNGLILIKIQNETGTFIKKLVIAH